MPRFLSRRHWISLAAILLAGAVLLYAFRTNLLAAVGGFLVVSDTLDHADMIFLLNGDPTSRPYRAAELYRQGLAPKVVIARMEDSQSVKLGAYPNPTDSNIQVLRKEGVAEPDLVELRPENGVMHTVDEAHALLDYIHRTPAKKIVIVTSDFHTRRARYTFRRVLRGENVTILMAPVHDLKYGADDWWKQEDGIIGIQNEYIKLLFYYYNY